MAATIASFRGSTSFVAESEKNDKLHFFAVRVPYTNITQLAQGKTFFFQKTFLIIVTD